MAAKKSAEVSVIEISEGKLEACILGRTPTIMHSMSKKAKGELLLPKGRKTAAERKQSLKHNPWQEFYEAPYKLKPGNPAHLAHLSTSFKNAIRGAALDVAGATKAQIGRLLWVEGEMVPIFGVPQLFMSVVRMADINKTPDVRTRVIVPEWAARITVRFVKPTLNHQTVVNLLAVAGVTQGIGDWRPQKGSGNYGQFDLVEESNRDFKRVMDEGGYEAQEAAMKRADPYDAETEELLTWFDEEAKQRGLEVVK